VRRYSKLPHLWSLSKRLARWLEPSGSDTEIEPRFTVPHVHKLSQRLSEETVAALVQDYNDGASLAKLQRSYSLGRGSVLGLLREVSVRRRRKSLTDAETAELVERYEAGLTIREIAAEHSLPNTTVQDALARADVVMRPAARRTSISLGVSNHANQ
jgi:DNA-directed RNA polymerase specialized sigma24 family protein